MTQPPVPIVWAKLQPPRLSDTVLGRTRLIDAQAAAAPTLWAIVAPAGYGKTTAAVQIAAAGAGVLAWVALDPGDDDPVRFWTYVAASLSAAGVAGAASAYRHLRGGSDGVTSASAALRASIEAHPDRVTLVLDDLHLLADETVQDELGDWFRHPMANLTVVGASRRDLPLPVGRLRSQGLLAELRVEDLAFVGDETGALLEAAFGLDVGRPDRLEVLQGRTEGWPVGVYLAGLALRGQGDIDTELAAFAGDTRHLAEYLSLEAVDGLSDDARAFVLATSVVDVLEPDLCDQLTGMPGSLAVLRQLLRENVFTVALDASATVFRYHPLFREHLLSTLRAEHPDQLCELHNRASAWFERAGDLDQAIMHAAAGGEPERAQDLVGRSWRTFSNAGQFGTLLKWVAAIDEGAEDDPQVCLMLAWAALNHERYGDVDQWLDRAVAVAQGSDAVLCGIEAPTIRAHRARHRGDVERLGVEAAALAADPGPDVGGPETGARRRELAAFGAGLAVTGTAAFHDGRFDEAMAHFTAAISHANATGEVSTVVLAYSYLALIQAERGATELAMAHADQALALVEPDTQAFHRPVVAYLARSLALLELGRPADAMAELEAGRGVLPDTTEHLLHCLADLHQARVHHALGEQAEARASLRAAEQRAETLPDPRLDARLRAVANDIRFAADAAGRAVAVPLTEREVSVLRILPHDLTRSEVAEQLHVSENTVKTHLTSIGHKLGARGRKAIVARARELGLL